MVAVSCEAQIVLVPGSNGKNAKGALEGIRNAVQSDSELVLMIQSAINVCSSSLQDEIDDDVARIWDGNNVGYYSEATVPIKVNETLEFTLLITFGDANLNIFLSDNGNQGANFHGAIEDNEDSKAALTYVSQQAGNFDLKNGGYPLSRELKTFGQADLSELQMATMSGRHASVIEVFPSTELISVEIHYLSQYWDRFEFKVFTTFEPKGLQQFVLYNANTQRGQEFLESYELIHVTKDPKNANVTESHALYKTKVLGNGKLYCKAGTVTDENHDNEKATSDLNRS